MCCGMRPDISHSPWCLKVSDKSANEPYDRVSVASFESVRGELNVVQYRRCSISSRRSNGQCKVAPLSLSEAPQCPKRAAAAVDPMRAEPASATSDD
eukprot:CAMPEP_0177357030 /NCGR_PEP_ID=MMETSP0368-20130122/34842_1 /TAXON_ID=447022 ORGANISM="Scrippsiella hangoei-like, Strain SHHI-4" /NCGR_SAMPLE_ID=MMETSP0368 /ASSEMBLY_ACC=CAM_ASM_000363 /LENGTH=96 /DNA_ID=CAMNT_0018819403 /DNA_START=648 /DNA_END=936 /DNA_ORIENTATION=-